MHAFANEKLKVYIAYKNGIMFMNVFCYFICRLHMLECSVLSFIINRVFCNVISFIIDIISFYLTKDCAFNLYGICVYCFDLKDVWILFESWIYDG